MRRNQDSFLSTTLTRADAEQNVCQVVVGIADYSVQKEHSLAAFQSAARF